MIPSHQFTAAPIVKKDIVEPSDQAKLELEYLSKFPFNDLSLEIISNIASFLPFTQYKAMKLVNHNLYSILKGEKQFIEVKKPRISSEEFKELISSYSQVEGLTFIGSNIQENQNGEIPF